MRQLLETTMTYAADVRDYKVSIFNLSSIN